MPGEYPVPRYVAVDKEGMRHEAWWAGPDHCRYLRTTCDWWRSMDEGRVGRQLEGDAPITCLACIAAKEEE